MTTRGDMNRLSTAQREVVAMAQRDLVGMFATMDLSRPERVRDALLEVVPLLVREYGAIAATAAAEWYEQTRGTQVGGRYAALLGDQADPAAVAGTVRWAAGHLWTEDPSQTLTVVSGAIQRYIRYAGRDTVSRNIGRDPRRPRWGRVPRGDNTCAFCEVMASRGFVYLNQRTAGGLGNDYHTGCGCEEVPEWDAEQHHITGYDPDGMYDRYLKARAEAGSGDIHHITLVMRRQHPELYTDGVLEPEPEAA